jgi:hypothetical protein
MKAKQMFCFTTVSLHLLLGSAEALPFSQPVCLSCNFFKSCCRLLLQKSLFSEEDEPWAWWSAAPDVVHERGHPGSIPEIELRVSSGQRPQHLALALSALFVQRLGLVQMFRLACVL